VSVCCTERLLTAKDVAAMARVHLHTFYRWCALGLGPRSVLLGRSRRYRERDIAKWMGRHGEGEEDKRCP
jgi:predicted DNA-binding transcriptional regulator AlpA